MFQLLAFEYRKTHHAITCPLKSMNTLFLHGLDLAKSLANPRISKLRSLLEACGHSEAGSDSFASLFPCTECLTATKLGEIDCLVPCLQLAVTAED